MTTFAPHRDTMEAFVDAMHSGANEADLSGILAEDLGTTHHRGMTTKPAPCTWPTQPGWGTRFSGFG